MKTSTRISLWFTLLVGILMLFFIMVLNIWFFASRHNNWRQGLMMRWQWKAILSWQQSFSWWIHVQVSWQLSGRRLPLIEIKRDFTVSENDLQNVEEASRLRYAPNIYKIDENWFSIRKVENGFLMTDVTQNVYRQTELMITSVFLWFCFMILTYILSRFFVSRSLRDLYTLSDSVRNTTIDTLWIKHTFAHLPADDEINVVAWSINTMQQTLDDQIQSMKDFVSHVSHEFKNPLMVLQSTTELAQKTWDVSAVLPQYKKTIAQMRWVLDTLTLLSRSQSEITLQSKKVAIYDLVEKIVGDLSKKYAEKNIMISIKWLPTTEVVTHKSSLEIILVNIIENAFKYTKEGGNIDISVDQDSIKVKDNWIGISQEAQKHIWDAFWQVDKNREDGVWLGLHLIKRLTEILWWSILLESKEWEWTTVTLLWGNK